MFKECSKPKEAIQFYNYKVLSDLKVKQGPNKLVWLKHSQAEFFFKLSGPPQETDRQMFSDQPSFSLIQCYTAPADIGPHLAQKLSSWIMCMLKISQTIKI